ncbi:hypothetical protein BDF20DRAFT_877340 [Mycotypha africana]|uniref:uncharacterized protein n=1 Tax=Mycotypha africana TaxID=64632 RepID=UPI0022FFF812|nr:uncharacterized protein BDF20DRAFT_877340 [Mycotypha africana]KAI8975185.1 hypothetical protein BDF20DRAFT_877340 [Mycotypha africana]
MNSISKGLCRRLAFKRSFSSEVELSATPRVRNTRKVNSFVVGAFAATVAVGCLYYNSQTSGRAVGNDKLDDKRYVPLKLIKKEQISPDSYLLRINIQKEDDKPYPIPSAVFIKDDSIQIMRPYTPINPNPYKDGYLDLVVKKYDDGSVSRTLTALKPDDNQPIFVRGPMKEEEYDYKPHSLDQIGMIAGGTGISPMYQLICHILQNPNDKQTKIWLIYGNKSEKDILLQNELDELAKTYSDRFKVKYILDQPPPSSDETTAYEKGYVTKEMIQKMLKVYGNEDNNNAASSNRLKIFVCGPNAMLAKVCGERAQDNSQGQVRGILAELGLSKNEVFKFQ